MARVKLKIIKILFCIFIAANLNADEELPIIGDASSSVISIASEYNLRKTVHGSTSKESA